MNSGEFGIPNDIFSPQPLGDALRSLNTPFNQGPGLAVADELRALTGRAVPAEDSTERAAVPSPVPPRGAASRVP